ncbi:MAG: GAF domain-containing protein [Chloroflexota bacterium]
MILALLGVFYRELFSLTRARSFSIYGQVIVWTLSLVVVWVAFLVISRFYYLMEQRRALEQRVNGLQSQVHQAYERLEAIFRVSQRFVEAEDENQVIEPVLRMLVELTGAVGATFVPLDEHGQPQTALSFGEMPFPVMEAWLEYLTSPGVRDRCRTCENREPVERPLDCPLLRGPFADVAGLACYSIRRGEREYGVMNIFLPEGKRVDERLRVFLQTLFDETSLGLEGVYLRRRELSALRQMQVLHQKADLSGLLDSQLKSIYHTLEADFALMLVPRTHSFQNRIDLLLGSLPAHTRPFLDGFLHGVIASGEPVLVGDLASDPAGNPAARTALKSLVAAPLLASDGGVLGAVLVANRRAKGFQPRQLALLQTFAGQAALVVQNAGLMAELEYKTMIQERARLAREIHDGLAQTIGFLKLQGAQLRGYLHRGEFERANQAIDQFYNTLAEAYQDARQAIDGLRISPDQDGLTGWLAQVAHEFQELSGMPVDLSEVEQHTPLSPEVQAQLIRIVQEGLSNIRKHAHAGHVWISCCTADGDLVLEVRDDGEGFTPEDVVSLSRHGLRGMRERAELVGADFQVISRPQEGTIVRVRLPLKKEVPFQ